MSASNIVIGFSPCPNDTFIFYALLHHKIDTKGISFTPYIADVEELNQKAVKGELPLTKLSFGAYLTLTDRYRLLQSGAALGRNCGPLLIVRPGTSLEEIKDKAVAIPGELTTANFLLDYFLPFTVQKKKFLFSEIEEAILSHNVEAGVIIHENRFTYEEKGLVCLQDLGTFWELSSGQPIPLGGIVGRRDLEPALIKQIEQLITQSIRYAYNHQKEVMQYVRQYAQEMDEEVMKQHISLYVNEFSLNLGKAGRLAVQTFFEEAKNQGRNISPFPLF